jgi:DNA-directed RNA polymerase subunit M/transcription elongation factor TFIIS
MPSLTVVTRSHPKPEPEWLIEHRAAQALLAGGDAAAEAAAGADKRVKRAEVKEECPKCKNPIMQFYTMQLRSVRLRSRAATHARAARVAAGRGA